MRNKEIRVLSWMLCLLMVLALLPAASAESRSNAAYRGLPNNATEGQEPPAYAEAHGTDDGIGKVTPTLVGEKTNKTDKGQKPAGGVSASALDSKPADVDKPNASFKLTGPDEKKEGQKASEQPDASAKNDVYSGTLYMGMTSVYVESNQTVYLTFSPSEAGTYRFYTVCDDDTVAYLQDSSYNQIAYSDDDGYGHNFMITYDLDEGSTYYVGVRFYSNSEGTLYVFAERIVYDYAIDGAYGYPGINNAGDTIYYEFSPYTSGTYRITSVDSRDTFGWLANNNMCVFETNDDGGYSMNFQITADLSADETYYIGARFLSSQQTGSFPVVVERAVEEGITDKVTLNWREITEPGTTIYRTFTAPRDGYYWFYSTECAENPGTYDTFITIANSNNEIYSMDDDSGYESFSDIRMYLEEGETIRIGERFYFSPVTGILPLMIEYPFAYDDPLALGSNTFAITDGSNSVYRTFTPTVSGKYKVYSDGEDDTIGMLMDPDWNVILYSDDSNGTNFSYEYEMEAGETYRIGARYWSTSMTGNINVIIESEAQLFDGTIEWNPNDVSFKGTTPYVIADGSEQMPRFTVKDADGNVVDPQYYYYNYAENYRAGTGYVIVSMMGGGYQGELIGWFKIYLPPTTNTYVENTADGILVKWDPVEGAAGYVIYRRAWNTSSSGWTTFARWDNTTATTYLDGHDDSHKVYAGTRYQYGVKAYFERREDPISHTEIGGNVGDNYNLGLVGPLKTTVRITTRQLTKLVAGSKKITAYWSPSKNFTGYQVQRATDANFTKNVKTVKIADPTTSSKALGSLTNGTLYYVRVRSYHEFEGMTYFGGWSNVLSVKPGSGETVTPPAAKYRALCVGQNTYSSSPLQGCVNDMNALAGMLKGLSNSFTVTKLSNATASQILNKIPKAFSGATDYDVSLFSYSGHGVDAGGSGTYQGALVGVDDSFLTLNELATALSKVPGRVIVILDSCHSGSAIKGTTPDEIEAFNRAAIEAFSGYWLEGDGGSGTRMGELKQSKFVVITAASYDESSWDGKYDGSGYSQGAFSAALIKGMGCTYPKGAYSGTMPADRNNDGKITLKELYDYAYQTAISWANQHAQYYGVDSKVLFYH